MGRLELTPKKILSQTYLVEAYGLEPMQSHLLQAQI